MVSPLRNLLDALDFDADHPRASRAPKRSEHATAEPCPGGAASDDDLQRLQSSVQWVNREVMVVRLEAAIRTQKQGRRLPRASQLTPANTEGSCREREKLACHVAPPLACERLQVPTSRRRHADNLRGALCILIAGVIAGSIAYHISVGGLFLAWEPAQAASVQAR